MPDVKSLSELETTAIDENLAFLRTALLEEAPDLDLSPGSVLFALVLRPAAVFHAINSTNMTRLRNSNSLKKILEDPANVDEDAADNVLSNYNIERRDGAVASGNVMIVTNTNAFLAISSTARFYANDVAYRPVNNFTAVSSLAQVNDTTTDKVFVQRSDGNYSVTIPVIAVTGGSAGNIGRGTNLTLTPPINGSIGVTAASDFTGGANAESTESLIARLQNGISAKGVGSRAGLRGLIMETFPTVTDVSVVGAGDPEMRRSSHNALAAQIPGYADVYVRTAVKPTVLTSTVTAKLADPTTATWTFSLGRDAYPALYRYRVLPLDAVDPVAGGLPVVSESRPVDTSLVDGLDFTPTMKTDAEGYFTRYQTLEVAFTDDGNTAPTLAVGTQRDYRLDVTYLPGIEAVSDYLTGRDMRTPGGNYLVKAVLPCFVAVNLRILQGPGDALLSDQDVASIRQTISDAVNTVDLAEGRLDTSVIINAVQAKLPRRSRVQTPVDVRGQVILPGGDSSWVIDRYSLVIPQRPDVMLSPRTTAFFCDASDVSVEVLPSNAPAV